MWQYSIQATDLDREETTTMWANAQRDGRPAKYRWCPLFNAAVWLTPSTRVPCSNAAKMQKPLKFAGVHQTRQLISAVTPPLVGRSSPYYEDMCRRYCCLTHFFDCPCMPQLQRYSPTKLCDGAKMTIFLCPVFAASHVQCISDMHSKFTLRPHHVWKYDRHPISDRWD